MEAWCLVRMAAYGCIVEWLGFLSAWIARMGFAQMGSEVFAFGRVAFGGLWGRLDIFCDISGSIHH